jgi:hypothetical protein
MMMKIVEAQGYSKKKAYETIDLGVDFDMLTNATISWKNAGAPISTRELNKFLENYIKNKKAVGAYIVIENSSDDTRRRPYHVVNEVTQGKRKATTVYQVKEADLKVKEKEVVNDEGETSVIEEVTVVGVGVTEGKAPRKDVAVKLMKELIEANKKDYVIEIGKEITEGQKYASYGVYTPSKSAKLGKFVFAITE